MTGPSVRVILGPKGQLQMCVPHADEVETTLDLLGTPEAMLHQIQRVLLAQQLYGRGRLGSPSAPVQGMLQDMGDSRWGETPRPMPGDVRPVRYSMGPNGKVLPAMPEDL